MKKHRLMSPGPTPVPEKVLLKTAETIIHHRTPEFRTVLREVHLKLKKLFCTENPVIIITSSGTGAMQASVVNLLSKGDEALIINGGKFGARFGEMCRIFGVNTCDYSVKWGDPADPDQIAAILKKNKNIKVVYSTLCETSTGVLNDIKKISGIVSNTDAVLVVDAISGLTADTLKTDEWGVDVVISGSQKGLMLPPGLSFLSISSKARELVKESNLPKYYFNLSEALKSHEKDDTPWTPAISLIQGLNTGLSMMLDEGLDNMLKRHASLADATREAIKAIGLEVFAKRPSNAVTSVKVPEFVDGLALLKKMREEQGITIAGGQADMKGKIFRIGHLGYMDKYDVISAIAALEIVLKQLGFDVELGQGVSKAQELLG